MTVKYPCPKREVSATIVSENGEIVTGTNQIIIDIPTCPRDKGEGYDKCTSVCSQEGHAETVAISRAKDRGFDLSTSKLYLFGHWRVCSDCQSACDKEDLEVIIMGEK